MSSEKAAESMTNDEAVLKSTTKRIADLTALLNAKKPEFHEKHDAAAKLFERANVRLTDYHHEREEVRRDARKAKEAFNTYMMYKEKVVEASADAEVMAADAEVAEWKAFAAKELTQYHTMLAAMNSRRSRAEKVRDDYSQLSQQYHELSNACGVVGDTIKNQTQVVLELHDRHDQTKARYDNADKTWTDASERMRTSLSKSREAHGREQELLEEKAKTATRYWEMVDLEAKYLTDQKHMQAESAALLKRSSDKQEKAEEMLGDIAASIRKQVQLKSKGNAAQDAGKNFYEDFRAQGCPGFIDGYDQPTPTPAPDGEGAELDDIEMAHQANIKSTPKHKRAMYRKFFKKFLGEYQSNVEDADGLAKQSKQLLGKPAYSQCQYYTKLVSMYTALSTQNLQLKDKEQEHDAEAFKKELAMQQKAAVNDARAAHFQSKMDGACGAAEHRERVKKEVQLREDAFSSQVSAMSFLQMSASESENIVETHLAKTHAILGETSQKPELGEDLDAKMKAKKDNYCRKQKELAVASRTAAVASKNAREDQTEYLQMARAMHAELANAEQDARHREKHLQAKIRDFADFAHEAAKQKEDPCSNSIPTDLLGDEKPPAGLVREELAH